MTLERPAEYLAGLVRELCNLAGETEWVEFKVDFGKPEEIGEYISALANSAALAGKAFAYMVWGITDRDHAIVGTSFDPSSVRIGNEALENWLLRLLEPRLNFRFFQVSVEGRPVVVLEIERAPRQPVRFRGQEYIRVESYKKKLKDFPERERMLWRCFDRTPFEDRIAAERVPGHEVLRLLDYPAYFDLLKRPLPENRPGILEALSDDAIIRRGSVGGWDVTNLGAVLFAKRLALFRSMRRKAMRVIQYRGSSRIEAVREQVHEQGYASGFESLIGFVNGLLPSKETIDQGIRTTAVGFPKAAVRELVANALIHQDFSITWDRPDGRDVRGPHGNHESRPAAHGRLAIRGLAAQVAKRVPRVLDAPYRHLRGARERLGQGGARDRELPAPGSQGGSGKPLHPRCPVRAAPSVGHG